jgi:glycosyltransferase involved in cell wall biosynthesis
VIHFFHFRFLGASLLDEAKAQAIPSVVHLMDFWFLCPTVVLRRTDGALCDGPPEGGMGCINCVRKDLGRELDSQGIRSELRDLAALQPPLLAPRLNATHPSLEIATRPKRLRDLLLRADRIIAPSKFLHSMFAKNGFPPERIEVLTYGIDEGRMQSAGPLQRPPSGPLRCAFMGTIAEYKGADLVVDAILGSSADIVVHIHGRVSDFPAFSGPLVDRSKGDARIVWSGPFGRERLGAVLAETDIVIVPSRWYENTPLVALEAFAAGVPVFAADLGGMSELIVDGENGELFRPGDVSDLRRRLERIANERDRLARYRSSIHKPKSMSQNAAEFEAIYMQLVRPAANAASGGLS